MKGSLETLQPGDTLLVSVRGTNYTTVPKVQIEVAEFIETPRPESVLALLNADDDRFSQRKPRRAWESITPAMLKKYFDVDVNMEEMSPDNVVDLNILNPTLNGKRMHIQITETTTPTDWQLANVNTAAKRKGKNGDFIYHQGAHIFSNTILVMEEPQHTFLEADSVAVIQVCKLLCMVQCRINF